MAPPPSGQTPRQRGGGPRIRERGGAHLDEVGPGSRVDDRVVRCKHATDSEERQSGDRPRVADRSHARRSESGSAHSSRPGAELRLTGGWIQQERRQRVDQGQRVGTTFLGAPHSPSEGRIVRRARLRAWRRSDTRG